MNDLDQIAIDYHYRTEHHDRLVCSGVNEKYGSAMPRTDEENKAVQSNAYYCLGVATREGERIGATKSEVMKAISGVMVNGLFSYEREHELRNRNVPDVHLKAQSLEK